ncbi:MAG TPA: hypothetical protein VEF72_32330 [Mycobacterium sp.]|nr:hypothetical protein [Mycobacterium sp.]
MRKSLRMAGIAGAATLAILCASGGAELLGVAHADNTTQRVASHVERHCQPAGPKQGAFCGAD